MTTKKIRTVGDARDEKQAAWDRKFGAKWAREDAAAAAKKKREAEVAAILRDNPQIGVLMREGTQIYYVNRPDYREAARPEDLAGAAA